MVNQINKAGVSSCFLQKDTYSTMVEKFAVVVMEQRNQQAFFALVVVGYTPRFHIQECTRYGLVPQEHHIKGNSYVQAE